MSDEQPLLRVVSPNATPEDIAAIVTVLAALGGQEPAPPKPRSLWGRPVLRPTLHHGPGAWRAAGLPR